MQSLMDSPIVNSEQPKDLKTPSITSAPPPENSGSKLNLTESIKSSSSTESKIRCGITSERLKQLRKVVEDAMRDHKTFTIKGGWQTIRNQFLNRGWVERYETSSANKPKPTNNNIPVKESQLQSLDDVCTNLPAKLDWESQSTYTLKCERTIMSRMMQNHPVDFYWNMRRESTDWHHRVNTHQIMNRFCRSLFTSKEGLNLLLQQMHWHCEPGVAAVNFPRCYTLGFPDHYNNFIDDFRISACVNLLKWLVKKYNEEDEHSIKSPEGRVPYTALQFALDRCNDYVASQKHLDIDRDLTQVWNHEWDQFLSNYYLVIHDHALFLDSHEWTLPLLNAAAKTTLTEIAKYRPMYELDGMKNIWILKPGNKCRGRGIQLVKHMEDVAKIMNMRLKYVVQKYIDTFKEKLTKKLFWHVLERPLLIYKTKFDIRQWFVITSVQPLNIWMYRECYLRFSTHLFSLDNFHESLHLTNHAVQCKYANVVQRDKALPDQNMWDCRMFQTYLAGIGQGKKWEEVVYPGMRENIVGTMLACQDTMDRRPNTFELYGADFILSEDFKPWLLEINSSPDLSPSTNITSRLCPQCLQDLVKVVIDKRRNVDADTGKFELVLKQSLPRPTAYLGMNLSVRGRRIFKHHNKRSKGKDQKDKENNEVQHKIKEEAGNLISLPTDVIPKIIPNVFSGDIYDGPVIDDLIVELHQAVQPKGYEFIPAFQQSPTAAVKAKKKHRVKQERVSKTECNSPKNNTNKRNFVNRKSHIKGNGKIMELNFRKPRSPFIKNAYFGLLHEWKLKNKFDVKSEQDENIWEKDTSILKGKTILSKFNVQNLDNVNVEFNKKHMQASSCLSSVNLSLSLPQLHKIEPQFTLNSSHNNITRSKSSEVNKISAKRTPMNAK